MRRYALRDDQWDRIKDILPGREGHVGGTAADNRLFVEAVLFRFRAGVPWRDLHPEILNDSYVLLGSAARGVGSDRFFTPAGELPGVMIHAQSLWTLWHNNESLWGRHHEGLVSLLDLAVAFLAGAVFSLYLACRDSRMRLDSIRQALRLSRRALLCSC